MDPFSFGSTTALIAEEAEDRFDVEASLNEATLWQVLIVCKENIVTCTCRCSLCGSKVTSESALEWEKGEKNSRFSWLSFVLGKEPVKTIEKSGLCVCGAKRGRRLLLFMLEGLDVSKGEVSF